LAEDHPLERPVVKGFLLQIWSYLPAWLQRLASVIVVPRYLVVAGALIFNEQGQLLLCKHTYRRDVPWGLPGGHLEFGEDPSEAVRRELLEETGFSVRTTELLLVEGSHEARKVILTYLCSGVSGTFIPNEEVTQIQYFDLAALPPLRSEEQKTVEKALAILKKSNRMESVYLVRERPDDRV
jgi:ADP-ribose pyrophosphatase YjhB (NUDIX family)